MHVEGVLQLLRERLGLGALLQELLAESVHLPLQDVDGAHRVLQHAELALQIPELDLQHPEFVEPVLVLDLALRQDGRLDLDLLVQQRELVVPAYELGAEDVAIVDDARELLLLLADRRVGLVDDPIQALKLQLLRRNRGLRLLDVHRRLVELESEALLLLLHLHVVEVLLDQGEVLGGDLLLELLDLVVHDLKFALHLGNFILRLEQVLAVHVAVGANSLVHALLRLELRVSVRDALLQVDDRHLAHLHLLERLEELRRRGARLVGKLLPLLLQTEDSLRLFRSLGSVPGDLLLQRLLVVLGDADEVSLLLRGGFRLRLELGEDVPLAHELLLLLLLELALLAHGVDVPLEVGDRALEIVAVFLDLRLGSLGGSEFSQRGILGLVDPAGFQLGEVDLVILRLELNLRVGVALRQVCVVLHRVAEVPLQLGELIAEAVVVLLGPGRGALLVLEELLQALHRLVTLFERVLLLLDLVRLLLEELFQLLHVALHLLLALGLLVRRGPGGRGVVAQDLQLILHSQLIRLRRSELLRHLHDLFPEHDDLVHLLVALRRELIALSHHVLNLLLLLRAAAAALRCGFGEIGNLLLQRLDILLGSRLFLLGRVHHLPRLLHLALELVDRSLVLVRQFQRALDLRRVGDDLRVEVAALLDEPLLAVVGVDQRAEDLLVLLLELGHRRVVLQLRDDL